MARRQAADIYKSESGRVRQLPLTDERKRLFLAELRKHGVVSEASRIASVGVPRNRDGGSRTYYAARARDAEFAAAWDSCVEEAEGRILHEAYRRAVEGVSKRIYQRGAQVFNNDGTEAVEIEYSDHLMALHLRRFKAFEERRRVDSNVNVNVNDGRFYLGTADIERLSVPEVEALQSLFDVILANRAKFGGDLTGDDSEPRLLEYATVEDADFEEVPESESDEERELAEFNN